LHILINSQFPYVVIVKYKPTNKKMFWITRKQKKYIKNKTKQDNKNVKLAFKQN